MSEEIKKENSIKEDVDLTESKEDKAETKQSNSKLFSQEDLDKIIEKRLQKEKKKQAEAERLSKLTEEERIQEQLKIERAALEEERKEFERLKEESLKAQKEYQKGQMLVETKKALLSKGLDESLAELLITDDADSTNSNINKVKEIFDKMLQEQKNNIVKGAARIPKANIGNSVSNDKERFKKMNLFERQELKKRDPDLYKKLSGR